MLFGGAPAWLVAQLPLRRDATGGTVWSRPQPLQLPFSFPQFFAPSLAADGAPLAPPDGPPPDTPRAADDEVMSVPVGAALQCTPGLVPLLRRCRDAYLGQRRAAERAQVGLSGGLEADELGELAEAVQATTEAYEEELEDDGEDAE